MAPPASVTAAPSTTVTIDRRRDAPVQRGENPCTGDELPSVAAFDVITGERRWSRCSPERAHRQVLDVDSDLAFVHMSGGELGDLGVLAAIDIDDGGELWRRPVDQGFTPAGGWPKGAFAGGGVIVLTEGAPGAPEVIGVDAHTGGLRWRIASADIAPPPTTQGPTVVTMPGLGPEMFGPVAGTEDIVVVLSERGRLAGLERTTGKHLWSGALDGRDESGDFAGRAAAAVLDDVVVLPAGPASVAIDTRTGAEIWRGERVDDPWAADNAIVGSTASAGPPKPELTALYAATGTTAWHAPGTESYGDGIALGDAGAYVIEPDTFDGLLAYDLTDGAVRWHRPPGSPFVGQPQTVSGDTVLLLWGGLMGGVSTRDGTVRWAWDQPVGSESMAGLEANNTTVIVAISSLPFAD